jgi:hypothetical protein
VAETGDDVTVDGTVVAFEETVSLENCFEMMRDNRVVDCESTLLITEAEVSMMVAWKRCCCREVLREPMLETSLRVLPSLLIAENILFGLDSWVFCRKERSALGREGTEK